MSQRLWILLQTTLLCLLGSLMLSGATPSSSANTMIETISYQGWTQAVRLVNSSVSLIAVPDIARVMHFSLGDRPNLIWQNQDLLGQLADPGQEQTGEGQREWRNFGGAKLWVAPQKGWFNGGWPPHYALDAAPCTVDFEGDTLVLRGQPSDTAGVAFERRIQLVERGADFTYVMQNTSDRPVQWGIWMVLQAVGSGRVYLPAPVGTQVWMVASPDSTERRSPEEFHYQRLGDLYTLDFADAAIDSKLFAIGDRGWLAYAVNGQIFFLLYQADPQAVYPEGEGSSEIYTGRDYIELEHVGALVSLAPGETTALREYWRLVPAPEMEAGTEMAAWVEATAENFLAGI